MPVLEVEISSDSHTEKFEVLYDDAIQHNHNMTFEILGELTHAHVNFGSNKIITGMNGTEFPSAYYGAACDQNVPCAGAVGDIQSSFDTSIHSYSWELDQFIYPINAVQTVVKDGAIDFKFPRRGLYSQLPVLTKLPSVINGDLWTITEDNLYINSINPGNLLVKLTTTQEFTFSQTVNTFCPVIEELEDKHLVGCSNCAQGVVLNFYAKSTCESGILDYTLTCHEGKAFLITRNCKVESFRTLCQVRIKPSTEVIKCTLHLKNGVDIIDLDFEAISPELETTTNTTGESVINAPNAITGNPDISINSSTNGFLDWFNGLSGWAGTLKWIVVSLICIVFICLVAYLIFVLIRAFA